MSETEKQYTPEEITKRRFELLTGAPYVPRKEFGVYICYVTFRIAGEVGVVNSWATLICAGTATGAEDRTKEFIRIKEGAEITVLAIRADEVDAELLTRFAGYARPRGQINPARGVLDYSGEEVPL